MCSYNSLEDQIKGAVEGNKTQVPKIVGWLFTIHTYWSILFIYF